MGKFSMNDLLNDQSKKTPEREATGFSIRNIPIGKIVPSRENKYGIRDIEELAANIEAIGLLHNLVVKEANAEGFYELVSGERRFRACKMLYNEGNVQFATIPCKVEGSEPPAFTELKLIYANATARELTDYEKTYQAGRIKEILQELKASGYKFKGRMREIVADMLNVSPAQMGRMESISKNLSPEFTEEFKDGSIGITAAYELSTLPEEEQAAALEEYKKTGELETKPKREPKPKKTTAAPEHSQPPAPQEKTQPEDNAAEQQPQADEQQPEAEVPLLEREQKHEDDYSGLKVKYRVYKAKDNSPVENCFVLRPDKDKAARAALEAYAEATENKQLSADIREWLESMNT